MKSLRTLINSTIAGTGTAFAGLVLATGLTILPSQSAHAQWFTCNQNFTFESTTNNRVRCVRTQPIICSKVKLPGTNVEVGTNPVNRSGPDVCRALQSTIDFTPSCPGGYDRIPDLDGNTDKCLRREAPTRQVN
jgi:hypothetical protein